MASSSSSSHYTSVSPFETWNHDVFLSFRGEDTRKNFVDHLYSALVQQGIYTYKDDQTLPRGEVIGRALMKAILESRIAIIVFSENYANSSWCLDELAYVMKCKDEKEQIVVPIFYHVDPSEVRKQKGIYGEAFEKHELENNNKVASWRKALKDAGNLSGWVPSDIANGHESKGIEEIVDSISNILFSLTLNINEDFIGLKTRLQHLKSEFEIWSVGVRMVGIWGVGGGGKTTLASSLYEEICCKFDGCCFLENIREESSKNGLEKLQEKILCGVLKQEKVGIWRVEEGRRMIKSRLRHKKILIVLDDVDHLDQLYALAGSHEWFGDGSRIVITTRDEHLLNAHKVDVIHNISLLDDDEAIKLLHKYAPQDHMPVEDYELLSKEVVNYAGGLPLALKVLGCFLCDKDVNEWKSALGRLRVIPDTNILEKLKISYDGLTSLEKNLFLDIACFFTRQPIDEAMEIFDACGFYPVIGLKVLMQKTLVTISEDGWFNMHDLIQETGHYIVRGEQPEKPENHSRVWKVEDFRKLCGTLNATTELDKTEAIKVYSPTFDPFACDVVAKMKKLRWIYWTGIPESSLPTNFSPSELSFLRLHDGLLSHLWEGFKYLPNLRILKLKSLRNLIMTPDFGGLPNLEGFEIDRCNQLEEIHPSVGGLENLVYLRVHGCEKLKMFPPITRSHKLESFVITGCWQGFKVSEIQRKMYNLKTVDLDRSGKEVASWEQYSTNFFVTYFTSCCSNLHADIEQDINIDVECCLEQPSLPQKNIINVIGLQFFHEALRNLALCHCNLRDGDMDSLVWDLPNLKELNLSMNHISRLNFSLLKLPQLQWLNVSNCDELVELLGLPSSIAFLIAYNCRSLETVGDISNCKWLWKVLLYGRNKLGPLYVDLILQSMLQGNAVEHHFFSFRTPSIDYIPKLFAGWLVRGKTFRLKLPDNWYDDFSGFLICFSKKDDYRSPPCVRISIDQEIDGEDPESEVLRDSNETPDPDCDFGTCVGYVSFNSLIRETTWWKSAYNMISFSVDSEYVREEESWIVSKLVLKKRKGDDAVQTTKLSIDFSQFYYEKERKYERKTFTIQHHSKSTINILWNPLR